MTDDTKDSMKEFEYKPEPSKWLNKPLFLPAGSVRALLAMAVVGAFIGLCVKTGDTVALAAIATMIAKDYFESKKV